MPIASQQFKKVNYNYDLISGKVNQVAYQPNTKDMFLHKYEYDADNRITNVYTSKDNVIWEQDAKYFYYLHGPMARIETGNDKVQASDYAYTIQGWIKGVNSNILNPNSDIGRDGVGTLTSAASGGAASLVINKFNAQDAYGYSLTYFNNASQKDYSASNGSTGTSNDFIASIPTGMAQSPDLFNGNIRQMVTSYLDARSPGKTYTAIPLLKNYTYDQLNRIETATTNNNINLATNTWNTTPTLANMYKEAFSYDQNGNILNATRNGDGIAAGLNMDNLGYHYTAGTNKLDYVTDAIAGAPYGNDFKSGQTAGNYTYDKIGNLISDASENITKIDWTVYGKIKKITKASAIGPISTITFKYDASGNRVSKTLMTGTSTNKLTTYYVRDAQGNVMSVYEYNDLGSATLNTYALTEQHIYGSSRVGMSTLSLDPTVLTPAGSIFTRKLGFKTYELSNHLGNVLTVVSDRKIAVVNAGASVIDHFSSEILSANDYYAFGMAIQGRKFSGSSSYRYGFNGKEKDDEIKGDGNSYDFDARMLDTRLGRWMACDPLFSKTPGISPYTFVSNMPIIAIDPDGKVLKIVSTDPAFRKAVFTQLQSLTDKQLVLLANGTVIEASKAHGPLKVELVGELTKPKSVYDISGLTTEKPKPLDTKLISDIINDPKITKILPVDPTDPDKSSNSTHNDSPADALHLGHAMGNGQEGTGKGSNETIYYDQNAAGNGIQNADGTTGRPAKIGLIHELGHALRAMLGKQNMYLDKKSIDPDSGGHLTYEEQRNRSKVDNPSRKENGVKQRAAVKRSK